MTEPIKSRRKTARLREPREGWPEQLIIPSPEDFTHDSYCSHPQRWDDDPPSTESLAHDCQTQCCMLGWINLGFGRPIRRVAASPDWETPADRFQCTMVSLADADPEFVDAEGIFEGDDDELAPLTGKQAHELWVKTAIECGYEVE